MELPKEIYLDTNMIHSWFRNLMGNIRKGREFKLPSILNFITSGKFNLITSNITKVEIIRYLVSEWGCITKEAEDYWNTFINSFNVVLIIVKDFDFNELLKIVEKVPTRKKTLVNLMHLQIAKKNNLWFITGEESLKEKYRGYYDKTLSYEDLRKFFS